MIKLTVPWENLIEEASERKRPKYDEFSVLKGWTVRCLSVEFGARGFPAQLVHQLLSVFGVKGKQKRAIVKNSSEAAERASNHLSIKSREINSLNNYKMIHYRKIDHVHGAIMCSHV